MYMRLCSIADIPAGEMKQFDLKDAEFLVVSLNGTLYCLDGRCTHAGAPLAEGSLNEDILTCPWHYSKFKITDGSVIGGPANKPLRTYNTMINDGQLFVDFEEAKD